MPLATVRLGLAATLFVGATLSVRAHDFWLVPDALVAPRGAALVVRGQTSSRFPTSESAVTVDRVVEARVLGNTSDETKTIPISPLASGAAIVVGLGLLVAGQRKG